MTTVDLLERSTFVTRFGGTDVREPVLGRLHTLLSSQPSGDEEAVIEWLEDVVSWVFEGGRVPSRRADESEPDARLRVLLEVFEEVPASREAMQQVTASLVDRLSATSLLGLVGLPRQPGLVREVLTRASSNVLPAPPVGGDLARLLERLFTRRSAVTWFVDLPQPTRRRLQHVIGLSEGPVDALLTRGAKEAALMVAAQVSALGLQPHFHQSGGRPSASPFVQLTGLVHAVVQGGQSLEPVDACLKRCREVHAEARARLVDTGISLDLVFDLERTRALLLRLERLVSVLGDDEARRDVAWTQLERELIIGLVDQRSLRSLWQATTTLLARRLVERAGSTGEHYLGTSRRDQHEMLGSAAGGGALTAVMVMLKFFIGWAKLPLLLDAAAIGLNYAWGFVAMQFAHFSLATKQPSMTAATLAGSIEERQGEGNTALGPLVDLVARASRTQLAALVGNVGMVIPVAVLIDAVAQLVAGRHVLDAETAHKVIVAHQPLTSGTFIFAAATGVCLWVASLIAGAVENWFIVNELPGALASNRWLRRLVGRERARTFSQSAVAQISGLGGNIGFGLLLGFFPLAFKLVGVPMEVRHVTFVMGQLVYAGMFHGSEVLGVEGFGWALLVVPLVGAVNFGVSFSLALVVALRSRGLGVWTQVALGRAVLRRLVRRPKVFFVAPLDTTPSTALEAR